MKLSKNSFNAKLYNFVWNQKLPSNLCNYFWKLVLSYFAVLLFGIFCIPGIIISQTDNFTEKFSLKERNYPTFVIFVTSFLLYIGIISASGLLYILTMGILGFFINFSNPEYIQISKAGQGSWVVIFIGAIILFTVLKIKNRQKENKSKAVQDKVNIIKEYIKAVKNKYCPIIEWKD